MATSQLDRTGSKAPKSGGIKAWQIALVAVVAVVAFVVAFVLMRGGDETDPAAATDPGEAAADEGMPADAAPAPAPAYDVEVFPDPDPPVVEGITLIVLVRLDGEPVSVDEVRYWADMPEHAHDGLRDSLTEVEPGRYEIETEFMMRGLWEGGVTISTEGHEDYSVPFSWIVE